MPKISENQIIEVLKKINDPEIGHSIVDMGLVYKVRIKSAKEVEIEMTLTSLGCPLGGVIEDEVRRTLMRKFKIKKVTVRFVFDPPWTPERMVPKLRASLGI